MRADAPGLPGRSPLDGLRDWVERSVWSASYAALRRAGLIGCCSSCLRYSRMAFAVSLWTVPLKVSNGLCPLSWLGLRWCAAPALVLPPAPPQGVGAEATPPPAASASASEHGLPITPWCKCWVPSGARSGSGRDEPQAPGWAATGSEKGACNSGVAAPHEAWAPTTAVAAVPAALNTCGPPGVTPPGWCGWGLWPLIPGLRPR